MSINRVTKQKFSLLLNKVWFLPLVITLTINVLGGVLIIVSEELQHLYLPVSTDSERAIISITSTSLITLIGLTFSISMLILSTVSNQFGPRLLPNFLQSKITQTTLGIFLGTFSFSLYCIYFDDDVWIRSIETTYVLLLTIVCLIFLVLFINKVIQSIQIDYILEVVAQRTKSAISSNLPKRDKDESVSSGACMLKAANKLIIYSQSNGYVQGIDYDEIKRLVNQYNSIVSILIRAGDYLYINSPVMEIYAENRSDLELLPEAALQSSISIKHARFLHQDIEFGFEQVSEIAVRALSPGINDPYTARQSLFLLGELFLYIEQYDFEKNLLFLDDKIVGQYRGYTYKGIIEVALARLRQAAVHDLTVILTICDLVIQLNSILKNRIMITALLSQVRSLMEMVNSDELSPQDKAAFDEREQKLLVIENAS